MPAHLYGRDRFDLPTSMDMSVLAGSSVASEVVIWDGLVGVGGRLTGNSQSCLCVSECVHVYVHLYTDVGEHSPQRDMEGRVREHCPFDLY